ncbi:23S rRNA pseudouridine2605 synthase [Prosthecobacter fusiformis]|uniref:Pseudouridine synthase n=1 Tax=Prosthecobacter fusiformis TaxID=48464 RepID=A0A4R7S1F9_9BACT|nr:pseudouridine synthase [Prosthecobacter fusiformis]TDU71336.1 23S rRNA pseudouridine2605 synthase [Prosthecobacter fusiformis]
MSRTGLARALSKLGHCSRSQGFALVRAGQVTLNGRICRDPEHPVLLDHDIVQVSGTSLAAAKPVYIMLNKPRGLVTTASDEEGRATVYECFQGADLPHLPPVGRLDKASEGLLLFTNDNAWAHRITAPETHLEKNYHVQVSSLVDDAFLTRLRAGVEDKGEKLRLRRVAILRAGLKNTWLDITLDEGRNRHIRRVLSAHQLEVLRLVRISIGQLRLGDLAKGNWRHLQPHEVAALGGISA